MNYLPNRIRNGRLCGNQNPKKRQECQMEGGIVAGDYDIGHKKHMVGGIVAGEFDLGNNRNRKLQHIGSRIEQMKDKMKGKQNITF